MKALSLKHPWAELVVQGKKTIETRKWKTNFRGLFYIHASGNIDEGMMNEFGFKNLPRQMIIGKAELIDVKEYKNKEEFDKDYDKHFAKTFVRYGFLLKNASRIKPIPCKGQLNFFDVKING